MLMFKGRTYAIKRTYGDEGGYVLKSQFLLILRVFIIIITSKDGIHSFY